MTAVAEPLPSHSRHRVVVTGLGTINPLSHDVDGYWRALLEGRSGIARCERLVEAELPTQIAAEVHDFNPGDYVDGKDVRRMARNSQFAVAAARMALEDSGINLSGEDPYRIGVEMGTSVGGFSETVEAAQEWSRGRRVGPFFIPAASPNMAACQVAISFGLKGPNSTVTTACAASTQSLGNAMRKLQLGEADVMLACGSEANLTPFGIAGFNAMRALSTRNEEPQRASRPFDRQRDGFVPGEGAGSLVLETLQHAYGRGATVYCELLGFASTSDAYHVVMPEPEGISAARCMMNAIADAGLVPQDVDYINAHGTSTVLNDRTETVAIKRAFGEHAYKLAVSSTKSMIGHLIGGAGAVEAVATVLTLVNQVIHPTINLDTPDPECDLDYVANTARVTRVDVAISNGFGFGGQNACVVFKRFEG